MLLPLSLTNANFSPVQSVSCPSKYVIRCVDQRPVRLAIQAEFETSCLDADGLIVVLQHYSLVSFIVLVSRIMNGRKKLWKDTPARALRGERPKSPDSAYSNFEEISQNGSDDEYAEHPIPAKRSQKKQQKTAKRSRKNPGEVMPAPSPEAGPSTRTTGAFGQC